MGMTWTLGTSGDACKAQSALGKSCAHPGWVLGTSILASSLAFVDGSVVNVGLPAIGLSLHADAAELQWIINAYLLPLSALLLLGGATGDRYGRRNILLLGVTLFGVSSALCAAAASLYWLLAARALQGIGAALVLPNSLAILGSAFTGEARGRAIGTWSATSAMTAAIGPVLGGWLIDAFGWREIFLINIPLAVAAVALGVISIREPARERQSGPLDVRGALLITSSLALLTWGLTVLTGRAGWSVLPAGAILAGILLLLLFLWVEERAKSEAIVPLGLFETREFAGLTILTFLLYGALGALLVLIPYLLIEGAGYSGTAAGAALLPFPVVVAIMSRTLGGLAGRVGSRLPLTLGPLVVASGFLLLRIEPDTNYWSEVFPAILVMSIGMAGAVAPLTTAVLASVDARHTGSASGLNSAVARLGGLVATALAWEAFFRREGWSCFLLFTSRSRSAPWRAREQRLRLTLQCVAALRNYRSLMIQNQQQIFSEVRNWRTGEGFEPPIRLPVCRISSAVHSTALPPVREGERGYLNFGPGASCSGCLFACDVVSNNTLLFRHCEGVARVQRFYPAVLERGPNQSYGVWFPDFVGCVAGGVSQERAIARAQEALAVAVQSLAEQEKPLPEPTPFERIAIPKDCEFVAFFAVGVEPPDPSERVNIYLSRSLLRARRPPGGRARHEPVELLRLCHQCVAFDASHSIRPGCSASRARRVARGRTEQARCAAAQGLTRALAPHIRNCE